MNERKIVMILTGLMNDNKKVEFHLTFKTGKKYGKFNEKLEKVYSNWNKVMELIEHSKDWDNCEIYEI